MTQVSSPKLPARSSARATSSLTQQDVMTTVVTEINTANRRENTAAAYDPKTAEYYDFCNHVYPDVHESTRYTVTPSKMFRFLFYHAMRNKYSTGSRKKGQNHGFDGTNYDTVWQSYQERVQRFKEQCQCGRKVSAEELEALFPDPVNPIGADAMNTYKTVVRGIWERQVEAGANTLAFDLIYTYESKSVIRMVQTRHARIRRKTYQEKIEGDFAPFQSMDQVPVIEAKFWENGKQNNRCALKSLRNRNTFLNCYSGILRHESLFLGELSDMVGLEHKRERDVHPMEILVMQIAFGKFCLFCLFSISVFISVYLSNPSVVLPCTGKTVKGKLKQFGRYMRHNDVTRCALGGFGLYLLFRFFMSGEMDDGNRPDFADNKSWFDIKILTDGTLDNRKEMTKKTYTDDVKAVLKSLKIVSSHYGHWGRVNAPVELEFAELSPELIRILGECGA